MKKTLPFILIFTLIIIYSCNKIKNSNVKKLDYTSKEVLDSLVNHTPQSFDTIFLGFTIGMSKNNYINHIKKLQNEGKSLSFSESNKISNIAGTFELGEGYNFKTPILTEYKGKKITGQGSYFLEPIFNKHDILTQLNIVPHEKWDNEDDFGILDTPDWLKSNISSKAKFLLDENLKQTLIDNNFIESHENFIYKKGNIIIYKKYFVVTYIDSKSLFNELLNVETEKQKIQQESKNIDF